MCGFSRMRRRIKSMVCARPKLNLKLKQIQIDWGAHRNLPLMPHLMQGSSIIAPIAVPTAFWYSASHVMALTIPFSQLLLFSIDFLRSDSTRYFSILLPLISPDSIEYYILRFCACVSFKGHTQYKSIKSVDICSGFLCSARRVFFFLILSRPLYLSLSLLDRSHCSYQLQTKSTVIEHVRNDRLWKGNAIIIGKNSFYHSHGMVATHTHARIESSFRTKR